MNDKSKNIISNILGLIIAGISIYVYLVDIADFTQFLVILAVGLSLFLFKASQTRKYLAKFADKKLNG